MRSRIVGFFLILIFSSHAFSQPDIVQGPFKLDNESSIFFKNENNDSYPLAFYYKHKAKCYKVDAYEVNGDIPHVETVFFYNIEGKKNVIILISWRQNHAAGNIDGIAYQVYGYIYSSQMLVMNESINNNPDLNGLDGFFSGEKLHFEYKSASKIKAYLKNHYK
ncbi:hypothetical protein LG71_22005 [Pluralibacter gergoviae]|uniref:hypothetical protein n=1 Tax=Pluralibacter gergoviae TaxID=61647 RepID=UPI0004F5F97C|nr:hypothetical protein [Pluralibacter gergoviae]AIR02402.1 hypothetical protein LG71_22005 [Pluralibacter gergoviae]